MGLILNEVKVNMLKYLLCLELLLMESRAGVFTLFYLGKFGGLGICAF